MISGSSELSADVKQQRTLNPAQENILNVTFIWRLNRIFLKFVDRKDFESFCREDAIPSQGERKPPGTFGANNITSEQSSSLCQFILWMAWNSRQGR